MSLYCSSYEIRWLCTLEVMMTKVYMNRTQHITSQCSLKDLHLNSTQVKYLGNVYEKQFKYFKSQHELNRLDTFSGAEGTSFHEV